MEFEQCYDSGEHEMQTTITIKVKVSQDLFAFFNGLMGGGR